MYIKCTITHETKKAILVNLKEFGDKWVPRSQIQSATTTTIRYEGLDLLNKSFVYLDELYGSDSTNVEWSLDLKDWFYDKMMEAC